MTDDEKNVQGESCQTGPSMVDMANTDRNMSAYHLKPIKKGILGYSSKIVEEVEELQDAEVQGNKILALCELADIVGAIDHLLKKQYPGIVLDDLIQIAEVSRRAFEAGDRK